MPESSRSKWTPEYREKVTNRFQRMKAFQRSQNPTIVDKFVSESKSYAKGSYKLGKRIGSVTRKLTQGSPTIAALKTSMFGGIKDKAIQSATGGTLLRQTRLGNPLLRGAKAARRTIKSFPKPIRRAGLLGGLAAGAVSMLGVAVMKGAMNASREIVYERYMQDVAVSKNVLNNTRLGLAAGTSRMQNMGSTMGLSNALSRTRHH